MYFGIRRAVDRVNASAGLHALVITGTGDVFAPGGELGGRHDDGEGKEKEKEEEAPTGVSPRSFQVDTVGDVLKLATGGKAKVFGVAFKDRAAVLMAGHQADAAFWFPREEPGFECLRRELRDTTLRRDAGCQLRNRRKPRRLGDRVPRGEVR